MVGFINMDKNMKRIYIFLTALAALAMTACHDEELSEFNFNATLEQPTTSDGSKVYLENERFVYWEINDKITIASDQGQEDDKGVRYEARLVDASAMNEDFEFFNGVFVTTMTWGSKYFLGIHPKMDKTVMPDSYCSTTPNSPNFGTTVKMYLPTEQGLRTDEKGDITFNQQVWPMVAWYGGVWNDATTAFNLDFHSVGSIVRLQLYNTTGSNFTLDSIEFVSKDNATQLSGIFNVHNYKTEDPYVSSTSVTSNNSRVAIAHKNGSSLNVNFDGSTLRSFYLVLPAYKGRHENTVYQLTMKVYAKIGENQKVFTKNFTVATRRNGITYMRAIAIDNWSTPTLPMGIVGNGTEERPFKIYTNEDLRYLRMCYNSDERKINNQPITANTWIRIMRSDIELRNEWSSGINNFIGHMTYSTTGSNSTQGILNNSPYPLFNSIGADGVVEGITVNCDTTYSNPSGNFSPFCGTNNGTIKNCRIASVKNGVQGQIKVQTSQGSEGNTVAGLCVTNNGTIIGSGCVAAIDAERRAVAALCLNNDGLIQGCYVAANTSVTNAVSFGGICHNNFANGKVVDCYYANIINNVNFDCGGIVYSNKGEVTHCYMGEASMIITTGSVGGIVNIQDGVNAKMNYCWAEGFLRGSRVGLIASTLSAGKIANCFCNNSATVVTLSTSDNSHYGGGLVGQMSGGSLENSFANIDKIQRINNIGTIGGLIGQVSGTTARIKNCYCYEHSVSSQVLYGNLSSVSADLFNNCFLVGSNYSGTATGITSVTVGDSDFDNMRMALNGNSEPDPPAGWDATWYRWEAQSNTNHLPRLTAYSASKRR